MHSTVDGHFVATVTILVQVNLYMQLQVGVALLGHRVHTGSVLLGPAIQFPRAHLSIYTPTITEQCLLMHKIKYINRIVKKINYF